MNILQAKTAYTAKAIDAADFDDAVLRTLDVAALATPDDDEQPDPLADRDYAEIRRRSAHRYRHWDEDHDDRD